MASISPPYDDAVPKSYRPPRQWLSNSNLWGYLFVLPAIIGLIVFQLFPILGGFGISLTNWISLRQSPTFVGLDNYATLLNDPFPWTFAKTLENTLFFVGTVPLGIAVSLGLALLVNQKLPGITLFRTAYFLPMVTAMPAVALVWQVIFQPRFGLANFLLGQIGIDGPNWLGDPAWFKPAVTIFNIWKGAGFGMIIFLAALQNINHDYYDAAKVDGATSWDVFRRITLPLISPQVFFVSVMLVIFSFNTFVAVYIFGGGSQGGPLGSGATIVLYIYQKAFSAGQFGVGAAAAYVLAAMVLFITLLQFRVQKRWVFYDN